MEILKRRDPRKPSTRPTIEADGPAKEVPELAVLAPFAGDWKVEMHVKPSQHSPEGLHETLHDEIRWVLGGRFLMGHGTSADGQTSAFWL